MRAFKTLYIFMLLELTSGVTYEPCSLLQELVDSHYFTVQDALGFVCFAYKISGLSTVNAGSDSGFGIFGIQPGKACTFTTPGFCGITCDKLIDDDITDDLECLEKILERTKKRPESYKKCEGGEWQTYVDYCLAEMNSFTEDQREEKGKYFSLKNFKYEDKYYEGREDEV